MTEKIDDECEILSKCGKSVKDVAIRKQNAKNRWRILARAILSESKRECCDDDNCVKKFAMSPVNMSQDFSGFEFVRIEPILACDNKNNYKIKLDVSSKQFECNVHIEKLWSVKDLIGFNNTGNLSLWASEAALCYYAMENLGIFDNAWVLELGGGMFCLSALMIGKYSNAFAVHLSDGNEMAVLNVKKSIILNDFKDCFMKCSGSHKFSFLSRNEKFKMFLFF